MTGPARTRMDEPTGAELDRLRKAYADRDITVLELQRRFRLSDYRIVAIAVREGWPLRRAVVARGEQQGGEART